MHIKNTTKKTLLAKDAKICKNILSKSLGLMFSKRMKIKDFQRPENSSNFRGTNALIFIFRKEKIIPLHMLFVFYPIDVLFLNKNKIIVEIKENFKPFTLYTPKNKALYIVELSKNAIKKSKTKIELGDKIEFS